MLNISFPKSFSVDPSFPTEIKAGQQENQLVYPLKTFISFATSIKASTGKWRTERSQIYRSINVYTSSLYKHHTVQCGSQSVSQSLAVEAESQLRSGASRS